MTRLRQEDVAVVSDAGMPGINDPGYELVCNAVENGVTVIAIPGPSVLPVALAVSGLPSNQFVYVGFWPRKKGERRRLLASIEKEQRTIVALEAPHRLLATLKDIEEIMGDRKMAVCRELTKVHEEVFRGMVSQAIARFSQPRGEFTLVIEGYGEGEAGAEIPGYVREELGRLRDEGVPAKEAVAVVASTSGLHKNLVYKVWLELS
jgi:16S rRNA (cytidine1402-2'-O)-methyltransferase